MRAFRSTSPTELLDHLPAEIRGRLCACPPAAGSPQTGHPTGPARSAHRSPPELRGLHAAKRGCPSRHAVLPTVLHLGEMLRVLAYLPAALVLWSNLRGGGPRDVKHRSASVRPSAVLLDSLWVIVCSNGRATCVARNQGGRSWPVPVLAAGRDQDEFLVGGHHGVEQQLLVLTAHVQLAGHPGRGARTSSPSTVWSAGRSRPPAPADRRPRGAPSAPGPSCRPLVHRRREPSRVRRPPSARRPRLICYDIGRRPLKPTTRRSADRPMDSSADSNRSDTRRTDPHCEQPAPAWPRTFRTHPRAQPGPENRKVGGSTPPLATSRSSPSPGGCHMGARAQARVQRPALRRPPVTTPVWLCWAFSNGSMRLSALRGSRHGRGRTRNGARPALSG